MTRLVLASTSRYRAQLLTRLALPFEACAPQVDEHAEPGEEPGDMAARLAEAKAAAVAATLAAAAAPPAIVIGSDQVPELEGRVLRKPGTHRLALEQLSACRNRTVLFHTAVCVLDQRSGERSRFTDVTEVDFADLGPAQLERYLELEQPYDCAGGFKVEGLGIVLFRAVRSCDPTALIGLPLIRLADVLRRLGLDPLADPLAVSDVRPGPGARP